MKNEIKALGLTLSLGLALLAAGCGGSQRDSDPPDLETLRAELKEQVAHGELTAAEAQVKLAEAFAEAKRRERSRGKDTAELRALGAELKEQVANGELTAGEAKAKWIAAEKEARTETQGDGAVKPAPAEAKTDGTEER